jgi:transcriptional regulator GlxA family with amidase domain
MLRAPRRVAGDAFNSGLRERSEAEWPATGVLRPTKDVLMQKSPVRVSLPVFPECDPSIVFGVYDTLWSAGRLWDMLQGRAAGRPLFEPRLVSTKAGQLALVTGVSVVVQDDIEQTPATDIVFVPNVLVDSEASLRRLDPSLVDWITRMYDRGAHVYAACGGSLVLAMAGLLDGKETTTHWSYASLLRRAFPNVKVLDDRILVQCGEGHRIVCCGGASSWQDLSLLLIARHAGSEEAIRISKIFLYQWHRDGQLPYASLVRNTDHDDRVINGLQLWLGDNYKRHDAVGELVRRSGLPKRTFDRRFKRATGQSPLSYIQALRIEEAKQLLEATTVPVEEVAVEVGYEDTRYFRGLFHRLTGMRPGDYRRKFQLPAIARATPAAG